MTDEEKIEYDKWEEEHQKFLNAWYEKTLPTMPYYFPTKEEIYVGMPVEKRVLDFSTEICCSWQAYYIYCLSPKEELRDSLQNVFQWEPHVITQKEYDRFMAWTGDYRNGPGWPIEGEIRIKKK